MTNRENSALTAADIEFLSRPFHGFLSTASGPVPAQPRPVWFEVTTVGAVQLFTEPESLKIRRLRRDARASLVVAAPVGERERGVSGAGPGTGTSDGAHELAARLAERYWDLDDPDRARELEQIVSDDQRRLVIQPDEVRRFSF